MNLLQLLGFRKKEKTETPYPFEGILHLWEDGYLMIELLPNENFDFIKAETNRIGDFGAEHFDGTGFTDITPTRRLIVIFIGERFVPFSVTL